MVRNKAAKLVEDESGIQWRSHEPARLETFSDAVFAFAVTLIIVSLEVPKTFTELFETMKGTLSFAACFVTLFKIWNDQNIFFRRYGLNDHWTSTLNGFLLFIVLIYAYPLKFLFNLLFSGNSYMLNGNEHEMMSAVQTPTLMIIYGAGFTFINLLFWLMYLNAKKRSIQLKLTPIEIFKTNTAAYIYFFCMLIGVTAMLMAWLLPLEYSGQSGFIYFLIGFAYFFWYSYRGRKERKLFKLKS